MPIAPYKAPFGKGTFVLAGRRVTVEWIPGFTPDEAATALDFVGEYLRDMKPFLLAARRIAIIDMKMKFAEEVDPAGHKWKEWSLTYIKDGVMPGQTKILTRTGAMVGAATSEASYGFGENTLFFSAGSPRYMFYHQEGATRDTRIEGGSGADSAASIAKEFGLSIEQVQAARGDSTDSGGLNILPQRAWFGLTKEARARTSNAFKSWVDEGISLFTSGSNVQFRAAGGQFGSSV